MSNSSLNSAPSSYPLLSGVPLAVTQANLSIIGNKGNSTYTYFVIANYPGGQVVSQGFTVKGAPDTVSASNYVRLNFTPVPNATSYDLLRLTGIYQSLPASVTNATLTTSTTSTSYNNQSTPSGGLYIPTLIGSSQIDLAIESQSTAYSRVYFNPVSGGPFELDLSAFANIIFPPGSGGGIVKTIVAGSNITVNSTDPANPIVSSTGGGTPANPSNAIQFNNAGTFGGSANLTWDDTAKILSIGGAPTISTNYTAIPIFYNPVLSSGANFNTIISVNADYTGPGAGASLYGVYSGVSFGGSGIIANVWGFKSIIYQDGASTITNAYAYGIDTPTHGFEALNTFVYYSEGMTDITGNVYYAWFDPDGVFRIKMDKTFDSVAQAIPALYNPLFIKYTPGAANYERIILSQWNGNIGEIGIEKGGTGTLRNLRLIGNGLIGRLSIAAVADGDLSAGDFSIWFDDQNTTPAINFKAKKANGAVVTATILLT